MDVTEDLEAAFDEDVTIERTTEAHGHEATAEFTIYCEPDAEDEVRERIAELESDIVFNTIQ